MNKFIYLDLETGGLDYKKHPILQLAGIINVGADHEEFNFKIIPYMECDNEALEINGLGEVTEEFEDAYMVYNKFLRILDKYIDKFDKTDKFNLVTYNGHNFDCQFLREFFEYNKNLYFGSYFFYPSIDMMLLAAYAAIGQRHKLPNFKLGTVARSLGIEVDESNLHDALFDVKLTKEIFNKFKKEYPIAM